MRNPFRLPAQVALLVSICLFIGTSSAIAQLSEITNPNSGRIILIDPKGALKIQLKGERWVIAKEGMLIRKRSVLMLKPAGSAMVICGDSKVHKLNPGVQGCPCRNPCTPETCGILYGGSTLGATRGPDTDTGLFPVIISPRRTKLRNLRPTIRWTPIVGAKEKTPYTVTLFGDGMKAIWTRNVVSQTTLAYPDKEPSLLPGQVYKVVVTSDGLSSQQDNLPGLGFTTLTPDQERKLAYEESKNKQKGLPETQTRFLIAGLYAARELYGEAIEQLEDLYSTMKEPAVAAMLGDLYAVTGLNREAEKNYLEALTLTSADDLEGLGLIQKNLAQVYENLGLFDRAIMRLAQARHAYQQLGNKAMVKALLKDELRLKKEAKRQ